MSLLIRFKCICFYWNDTIINVSVPSANPNPFTPPGIGYWFAEVINVISGNESRKQTGHL